MLSRSLNRWLGTVGLSLSLVLTACSHGHPKRIGVALPSQKLGFYRALRTGLLQEAEKLGLRLHFEDADGDSARQITQVQGLLAEKNDALLLVPVNSESSGKVVLEANGDHIPVFTLYTEALGGNTLTHIGTDEHKCGQAAARLLLQAINNKGKVAILTDKTRSNLKSQVEAFKGVLGLQSAVDLVADIPVQDIDAQLPGRMTELLQSNPDLAGIYATSEPLTLAAQQSLTRLGKSRQVAIIGLGGPDLQPLVQNGTLAGALIQPPDQMGARAIATVDLYLKQEAVPNMVTVPARPVSGHGGSPGPYGNVSSSPT